MPRKQATQKTVVTEYTRIPGSTVLIVIEFIFEPQDAVDAEAHLNDALENFNSVGAGRIVERTYLKEIFSDAITILNRRANLKMPK